MITAGIMTTTFVVSDLDRSADWYGRVLGLTSVARQQLPGGTEPRVAQFALPAPGTGGAEHLLALVEREPLSGSITGPDSATVSLTLVVTDLDDLRAQAAAAGAVVDSTVAGEGVLAGRAVGRLRDPDGHLVQLVQSPSADTVAGTGVADPRRLVLHSVLPPENIAGYRADHRRVPAELLDTFARVGIHDWEIWRSGRHLFHLLTCDDFRAAVDGLAEDPANVAWQAAIGVHGATFEGPDGEPGSERGDLVWAMHDQLAGR